MLPPKADRSTESHFAQDQRGTIAVLFALMLVPILGIVFGGIDYSRALSVRNQLQTAVDAAARSAAGRLGEGAAKAEGAFKAAFVANLPDELKEQPYDLSITGNGKKLTVEIAASVPTTMVALFGLTKLDVGVAAIAERPEPALVAGGRGGSALDAFPDNAEGARARAEVERALRSAGLPPPQAPDQQEIEAARRQM